MEYRHSCPCSGYLSTHAPAACLPKDTTLEACVVTEDPGSCKLAVCAKEKTGRLLKERIIPTPELELFAAFRTGGGMTWCLGSCPDGGGTIPPGWPVMNKQPTLDQDRKRRRSRPNLHNLSPKKDLKSGSSAQSTASQNGSSGIPMSLQEFLKRDSLPIKPR